MPSRSIAVAIVAIVVILSVGYLIGRSSAADGLAGAQEPSPVTALSDRDVYYPGSEDLRRLAEQEISLSGAYTIQQASNYLRLADRVWIAVPVEAQLLDSAAELREASPLLFEHAVSLGLGILACRKGRGGSYELAPIHWPSLNTPDKVERKEFLERHRSVFEEACVLEPKTRQAFPKFS